jgi:hypothetical protein
MSERINFNIKISESFDEIFESMKLELQMKVKQQSKDFDFDFNCDSPIENPSRFVWKKPKMNAIFRLEGLIN